MNLKMLQNYNYWIDKTPEQILIAVKSAGGWENVFSTSAFPKRMPTWASKVRNYFNEEPRELKRLDERTADKHLQPVERRITALAHSRFRSTYVGTLRKLNQSHNEIDTGVTTIDNTIAESFALSDDVYADEFGRIWFQMSAGGTIYHWKHPSWAAGEAFDQNVRGQEATPVFKLISPDGTGGSRECIIENRLRNVKVGNLEGMGDGKTTIGAVNEKVPVGVLIEKRVDWQGSYNYSETVEKGISAHDWRDVTPHPKSGAAIYYVDPIRFSSLLTRRFPRMDSQIPPKPLADQV